MTKNQTKNRVALPDITETLISSCSSRVSSEELADNSKDEEKMEFLKLPILVWPKEEINALTNIDNNGGYLLKPTNITDESKASETFQDELKALKADLKQLGTYQSPPGTSETRQSSEIYQEELKTLKKCIKKVIFESRDIILEVRMHEEQARKQANEEKKAAQKAAKLVDKASREPSGPTSKANTVKKSGNPKRGVDKDHEENVEKVEGSEKDSDRESVLSMNSSGRDDVCDESSVMSNSAEKAVKTTKRQEKSVPNNLNGHDIENKGLKAVNGFVNESGRSGINTRYGVVNLRPISEEGGEHTGNCTDKPKTSRTENEFETIKIDEENELLNDVGSDEENPGDDKRKDDKTNTSNDAANNFREQHIIKRNQHQNFQTGNHEIKGITTEEVDFFQSQRIRRQNNGDLFDSRLNDLESVSSKLTTTSTRRSSSVGLPGSRVRDRKFYLDRYRVPKQPMEIALQLHKLGLEFEAKRMRDMFAAVEACDSYLKKAIAQEKKDAIDERKRIEREAREKEKQEAQRRRMEEQEAKEAKRKEQEANERQKRRQAAIERRKYNLELLRNINNTKIQSKATRSYRFSYFPFLPKPKRHSHTPSPNSSDFSSEDESDTPAKVVPNIAVSSKPVKCRSGCHSGKTKPQTKK